MPILIKLLLTGMFLANPPRNFLRNFMFSVVIKPYEEVDKNEDPIKCL